MLLLDVHDIIVNKHESLDSYSEFSLNGYNGGTHSFTFGVTDFNLLQFVELLDSLGELHDVLASLDESIKADEQSTGSNFPSILRLCLVVVVCDLEFSTEVHTSCKLAMSIAWVLILDSTENFVTINLLAALEDNGIANLTDQDQKASWSVVVLRIGPDKEDGMHDRDKELRDFHEIKRSVHKLVEMLFKSLEILEILISLNSGDMDLFLKFGEGTSLG